MTVILLADLLATDTGHPALKDKYPQLELSPIDGCTSNPNLSNTGPRGKFSIR